MGFDVDCIGYSSTMLESEMGRTIHEPHCPAVGIFMRHEVQPVAPLPEICFAMIGIRPFFYCLFQILSHAFLSNFLKAVAAATSLLNVVRREVIELINDVHDQAREYYNHMIDGDGVSLKI